jgi:uncharacterized cysteine cluster protein YcgN (CxxCxxCC family)
MEKQERKTGIPGSISAPVFITTCRPFWKEKSLERMTRKEWELLCDGCGKCCLFKLEDAKTGKVSYTNVCCGLLDLRTCRCKSYKKRGLLLSSCAILTPNRVAQFHWLPRTCTYRLLYEGKDLPPWHHLVCGDRNLIHHLGHSVKAKVISEEYIPPGQLENYIVDWV